ncbi:vitamin K epoxide reductase family protein [Sinomonas halotolerans]|uniref:Vitamin K epoxide reductase family protein n=1 Tax=Sinomonas halotolerans TaxID=1644133 RepID=A0ABU9X058_9MICC
MTPQTNAAPASASTGSGSPEPDLSLPGALRRIPFAWTLAALSVVGWLASGALVLEKIEKLKNPEHVTVCDVNPWVSCGEVMDTWQSSVFGFPNMFIGIVAFAITLTTAMGILAGARFGRWYWIGLQVGVTAGFAFVVWLWSQALYAIGILCPFCMVVWAAMIPMFVLTTVRNAVHGIIPVPPALARALRDWTWVIVAVLYLGVIASVFFRFIHMFVPSTM